jgi:eukaryotic-like serine/threonine-protein kinase
MADAERWTVVKDLVARALDLAPEQRWAWLQAQPVDDEVRAEARELLEADGRAGSFLLQPALMQPSAAAAVHEATRGAIAPAVLPGQRLGAYRLDRLIGEGGMGAVYLATRADEAFEKSVAIKIVRDAVRGPTLVARLREERRLLATLDHPHIARLLDGGATPEGMPYVVMEYVDGVPIDRFCDARQASLPERVRLVRRVCEAVHHAHRNLVVHRDIKPSNILVTTDGTPKLLDFGIAKVLDGSDVVHTLTAFGAMTPESASPEQVLGAPITIATDVYGLGVLLYRLLTGGGAYGDTSSAAALLRAITDVDPVAPSLRAPTRGIPVDLDRIVLKAMAKRPHDRYDTASALADDLGRYLDGRPVLAAPDSLGYRLRRFVARHRLGTAAAAAAAVALSAGVAATLWQARIAERERQRAEQRLDDVRRLANTLIFEIHDAVRPLPGSTPVRRTIVERALGYLDALAVDASSSLQLKRELAAGYERLALVQGSRGSANLGDRVGAEGTIAKAVAIRRALVDASGRAPDDVFAMAFALERQAQLTEQPGAKAAAVGESLRLLDGLSDEWREKSTVISLRATLLWDEAMAATARKDYRTAEARHRTAVTLIEQLLQSGEPDPGLDRSRNLSITLKNLGALQWELGDRPTALASYRRAMDLDEARLKTRPDDPTWLLDLSFSVASLAYSALNMGDPAGAVAQYQRALELRQKALALDPQNRQAHGAVERGYRSLAGALEVAGQLRKARENLAAAEAMAAAAMTSPMPARTAP